MCRSKSALMSGRHLQETKHRAAGIPELWPDAIAPSGATHCKPCCCLQCFRVGEVVASMRARPATAIEKALRAYATRDGRKRRHVLSVVPAEDLLFPAVCCIRFDDVAESSRYRRRGAGRGEHTFKAVDRRRGCGELRQLSCHRVESPQVPIGGMRRAFEHGVCVQIRCLQTAIDGEFSERSCEDLSKPGQASEQARIVRIIDDSLQ